MHNNDTNLEVFFHQNKPTITNFYLLRPRLYTYLIIQTGTVKKKYTLYIPRNTILGLWCREWDIYA